MAGDAPVSVLLVDDDRRNLLGLEAVLEPLGLDLVKASSGDGALLCLLKHDFALVLLDVQMPGTGGLEVARLMRSRERTRRVPIIFLTAVHKEDDRVFAGYSAGAVDYLLKPFVPEILLAKVRVFVELHRKTEELRRLSRVASAASEAKSLFLAHMSHEIRTPMNGVLGMLGLLVDSGLPAEQAHLAEVAHRSARSLLGMLDDVLDFSKIEAGRVTLLAEDFDLREVVEEVGDQAAAMLGEKPVEVACAIQAGVPCALRGDRGRLRQVLLNLANNAAKFTDAGSIVVSVAALEAGAGEVRLAFSVADTGAGIAPSEQRRVMRPFEQADASMSRRHGGTGLGLSISRSLVELMGGGLEVESRVGGGSRFHFELRLGQGAAAPEVARCGGRVLVVGGGPATRAALSEQLAVLGAEVAWAADAEAAAAAIGAPGRDLDLVLCCLDPRGVEHLALARLLERRGGRARLVVGAAPGPAVALQRARRAGEPAIGSLLLPARLGDLRRALAPPAPGPAAAAGVAGPRPAAGAGAQVLVVDDDPVGLEVALRVLARAGYRTTGAPGGEAALQRLRERRFAAVLLDVQMPGRDGLSVARAIRSGEAGALDPGVPLIALTAHATEEDRAQCLAAGMDDHLTKPAAPEALERALGRLLGAGPGGTPAVAGPGPDAPGAPGPDGDPALEAGRLERLLGGDGALVRRVLDTFARTAPGLVAEAQHAARGPALAEIAHRLRGAAASVGAGALARAAAEVERAARAGADDEARQAAAALPASLALVLQRVAAPPEPGRVGP